MCNYGENGQFSGKGLRLEGNPKMCLHKDPEISRRKDRQLGTVQGEKFANIWAKRRNIELRITHKTEI